MKYLVLVAGLFVAGCGSSDGGGGSPVEGTWQVNLSNGCVGTYQFEGNKFSDTYLCEFESGDYGTEIESGTFTTQGTEIDFLPTKASCLAHSGAMTIPYSVNGDNLRLTFGSSLVVFQKTNPRTVNGGILIKTGCWDMTTDPGWFTAHAVQNL